MVWPRYKNILLFMVFLRKKVPMLCSNNNIYVLSKALSGLILIIFMLKNNFAVMHFFISRQKKYVANAT